MGYCKLKKGICDTHYPCKVCPHSKITNADRIRAMTDKEMATDLLDMFEEICEDGVPSKEWMMHWLQQPAEGVCDV